MLRVWNFSSLLFVGLALMPSGAHLLELPHKISLPAPDYLVVQQLYRGWALSGLVVLGELVSTAFLTWELWQRQRPYGAALLALVCVIGAQILFWSYTQPANRATGNWMILPGNWETLRQHWEYSHAASAILGLIGFVALIWNVIRNAR